MAMRWLGAFLGAFLLAALAVGPARAQEVGDTETIQGQVNHTLPVLQTPVVGTLRVDLLKTAAGASGRWTFDGSVGGAAASAAGTLRMTGVEEAATGVTLRTTLTAVTTWAVPGVPAPAIGSGLELRGEGNLVYATWENLGVTAPFDLGRPLAAPFGGPTGAAPGRTPSGGTQGGGTRPAASGAPAPAGQPAVVALPNTGAGPIGGAASGLGMLGGLLTVGPVVALAYLRRR